MIVFRLFANQKAFQEWLVNISGVSSSVKIVLVEIGNSHDECLLTQLVALKKNGATLTLICNESISKRNSNFNEFLTEIITIPDRIESKRKTAGLIWREINCLKAEKVIFNTAQGQIVRNICVKALFSKMDFIGIIHTTRKFNGSFTQRLINLKIKKYLLLSEFLYESVINSPTAKKSKVDYFYPIHFANQGSEQKDHQGIQVGIIGGVENRRKDLEGFLHLVGQSPDEVKFFFLGYSNSALSEVQEFIQKVKTSGLSDRVVLFQEFIQQEKFDELVQQMDFILPLVHPNTPSADQYFKNQISGAVNVAFAYQIPLLIHEGFNHITEFKHTSIFYSLDTFSASLQKAVNEKEMVKVQIAERYQKEEQENRFARFILD